MKNTVTLTHSGASATMDVSDAKELLEMLDEDEIVTVSTSTNEAGFRMARILQTNGFEIQVPTLEAEKEAPAKKPAKPKAPKLTKDQKAEIDRLEAQEENTAESLADAVSAEVSQVKRYLNKRVKG